MIKSVKPCENCGADKISDYKEYDGMLGYEAIVCKRCGFVYDSAGAHPTMKFYKAITKTDQSKYTDWYDAENQESAKNLWDSDREKYGLPESATVEIIECDKKT